MPVDKLAGVHPDLVERIRKVLVAMEVLGFPMKVTDGLRTTAQQQALFAQGRTTLGRIVTYADGVKSKSNHQARADGYGHAIDAAFVLEDGSVSWADYLPWGVYGAMVAALGLKWGGHFIKLNDRPHAELP